MRMERTLFSLGRRESDVACADATRPRQKRVTAITPMRCGEAAGETTRALARKATGRRIRAAARQDAASPAGAELMMEPVTRFPLLLLSAEAGILLTCLGAKGATAQPRFQRDKPSPIFTRTAFHAGCRAEAWRPLAK